MRKSRKARRKRVWHVSPEGFRELRHSCFLSQAKCAEFLGVSLKTVRHWDAGRNRVPWSVVRILRLHRLGDLGAIQPGWDGWTLNRNGLFAPDGRKFELAAMRNWWSQIDRARLWQEAYDRGEIRGCGGAAPARPKAVTLQPEVWQGRVLTEALPPPPAEAQLLLTALSQFLHQVDPFLVQAAALRTGLCVDARLADRRSEATAGSVACGSAVLDPSKTTCSGNQKTA